MKTVLTILVLSVLFAAGGCNIINPVEPTPTYVHIDSFSYINSTTTYGNTHKITSVWATFNGKSLGAYTLPADIPVLASEKGELFVAPGVDQSGLTGYKLLYPYYQSDSLQLSPNPGRTVNFAPETGYFPSITPVWGETFDGGNNFIRVEGDTNMAVTSDPSLRLTGNSGYVYLKAPQSTASFLATTPARFTATQAYLELDYRCTMPFQVGLFSEQQQQGSYILTLYPKDTWDKLYISLEAFISTYYSTTGYRVQIRADLPGGQANGYLLLDNVKIVAN